MQKVSVVALTCRRCAEGLETLVGVVEGIKTGAPTLVRKGWIGNDVVERLERIPLLEFWVRQRVSLYNQRRGVVVQYHVHSREATRGGVFFLSVESNRSTCLISHFQQKRP